MNETDTGYKIIVTGTKLGTSLHVIPPLSKEHLDLVGSLPVLDRVVNQFTKTKYRGEVADNYWQPSASGAAGERDDYSQAPTIYETLKGRATMLESVLVRAGVVVSVSEIDKLNRKW